MLSASVHRKIFQFVDPFQHQDVFSKGLLGEFFQLQPFQVEIYFKILKLTPQRRHASELLAFADFFGVREKFFHLAYIWLNLVTALRRLREQCSLEDHEF